MINSVALTGRLTRDIELKQTQGGIAVTRFTLAVNRNFKNANGETEADFINCTAWRQTAETMANYLKKGSLIGVEGRIQTGSFEKDGQRVFTTEVIVDNFSFLESRAEAERNQQQQAQQQQAPQQQTQTQKPFAQPKKNDNPFKQTADVLDDDLPF